MNALTESSLFKRIKTLLLDPDDTWPVIAQERTPTGDLLRGYALPLMAIAPVAGFVSGQLFGSGPVFERYDPSLIAGIGAALLAFAMAALLLVFIVLIAERAAPKFAGRSDRDQAIRLAVYSLTPGWLAGLLEPVPGLGSLALFAFAYGIFLFYKGAPRLLAVPEDRAGGFTALTTIAALVCFMISSSIIGSVAGAVGIGLAAQDQSPESVTIPYDAPTPAPPTASDVAQASRALDEVVAGKPAAPVDVAKLVALLPSAVGTYQRSAQAAAGSPTTARAEAGYKDGSLAIKLSIVDLYDKSLVAKAEERDREDANGYRRTRTVAGAVQTETWDNSRKWGRFETTVAGRFVVTAEGEGSTMAQLEAAVDAVDQAALAKLAQ